MTQKEQCIQLLDEISEQKLVYVLSYLHGIIDGERKNDEHEKNKHDDIKIITVKKSEDSCLGM